MRATASGLALTETGCARDQVPASSTTNMTYYPTNRLKTVAPPAGTQGSQFYYDNVGNLTTSISGNSIWNGTYNFRNMLTGESLAQVGQTTVALGYAHDPYGSLTLVHYPSGESVSYAPNPRGRETQAVSASANYATSAGYFANGQMASYVMGNGVAYIANQNQRQMLKDFNYGTVSALSLGEQMTYDGDANITAVADLQGGPRGKQFGYDGLNRLYNAQAPGLWGSQGFKYDPINNLRVRIDGSQTSTYNYDATNRLRTITGGAVPATFQYDPRGNVINKNGVIFNFDQKDQLSQIQGYDSYLYNADGLRTIKTVASTGATTFYFYSHAGQLMYSNNAGQSSATNYIYLGSKLIARNSTVQLSAPGAITFNPNPNNGSYTVSWGSVIAATSYVLQESYAAGAWTQVYQGSNTSAPFTNKDGGTYVYRVQACINSVCGAFTTSSSLGVTPRPPTLTVPSGVVGANYTVSWNAPLSATSYIVQESLNGGCIPAATVNPIICQGAWTTIGNGITATSIARSNTAGGTYSYQVAASNSYGTSNWSAVASVSVAQIPATPTNFTGTVDSTNHLVLTWDAMPFATSYTLVVYGTNGSLGSYTYFVGSATFSVPAPPEGHYTITLAACSSAGCSATASYGGNNHGLSISSSSSMLGLYNKAKRVLNNDPDATTGCTLTTCTIVTGDGP